MLSKTVRFDADVLDVLRAITWSNDGLSAKIATQLDRDLYERVNKALVAMGGKWNRAAKAHLFPTDPRSRVEGLLESGTLTVKRDGYFPTPPDVALQMVNVAEIALGHIVLEPSAGLGHLADVARLTGAAVWTVELDTDRADALKKKGYVGLQGDFLETPPDAIGYFDRVLMNPPFENGQDIDHVRHAFKFLKEGGRLVAIMSEGPFFRQDRKAREFRGWLDAVGGHSEELSADAFLASDNPTRVQARIVVIDR